MSASESVSHAYHCALAASIGPQTQLKITQMTRGWSTNIHNPPYRAYLCIHPFIAATVLIIDFYCRPLQVQISWKSPSLHEVRAEEHEPEIMLRQDARRQTRQNSWHWLWLCTPSCWQHMEAMAAGAFVCTCSWTCLEVSCTCCPSVWLRIAISIWSFHNPMTTLGATTRNSNKTMIDNNAWSACIFLSYLLSSLDSQSILSQVLHFTCILSSIHTHASRPNSAPVEVGILQTLGPAKGYI